MEPLLPIATELLKAEEEVPVYDALSDTYACTLCGTGNISPTSIASHFAGATHRHKMSQEVHKLRILDSAEWADAAMRLDARAQALGCSKWTKAAHSAIFCSLAKMQRESHQRRPGVKVAVSPTASALKDSWQLLDHFEEMERLSLLELAVWKALCSNNFPSPMRNLLEVWDWQKTGWKSVKSKFRQDRGINIILSGVVPFLGNEVLTESKVLDKPAQSIVDEF